MFRIIELSDGTTIVFNNHTGRQIQTITAPNRKSFITLKPSYTNGSKKKPKVVDVTDDTIFKFDFSSYMGQKLVDSIPSSRRDPLIAYQEASLKCDKFCSTSIKLKTTIPVASLSVSVATMNRPVNSNSKKLNLRSNTTNGHYSTSIHRRENNYCHQYSFTKTERLQRYYFLQTGLNAKGRLLSHCCKKLTINLDKLTDCPICDVHIGSCNYHRCQLTPTPSVCNDLT